MGIWETILAVTGVIGIIVTGVFSAINIFDRQRKKRQKANDEADDRLVNILKDTVAGLEKKVETMGKQLADQARKILKLETENETMTKVLQGRDADAKNLYENAKVAKNITEENRKLLLGANKNIERLAAAIEKHLDNAERAKV